MKAFEIAKETIMKWKGNLQNGGKYFQRCEWQGINFQNIQITHITQYERKKQVTQLKMDKRTE